MATVNPQEAKTNLSALADRAATGEEIIIAKAGRPLGLLEGQIVIADDFDAPLHEDMMRGFRGETP